MRTPYKPISLFEQKKKGQKVSDYRYWKRDSALWQVVARITTFISETMKLKRHHDSHFSTSPMVYKPLDAMDKGLTTCQMGSVFEL
jgi:hypothetical protein